MPRGTAKVTIGILVGIAFLWLAMRSVPLAEVGRTMLQLDPRWLIPAVIVSLLIQIFRAWRWQLELRPLDHVPFFRVWAVTSVAYMAINLAPARLGEVVRPWLMARRSRVTFGNVVGNLVVEKTIDSLVIVAFILIGLTTTANLPEWVRHGASVPAVVAAVLVILVTLLWWRGEAFLDRAVLSHVPDRAAAGIKKACVAVVDGMRIIPNGRLLSAVLVLSVVLWFLPILSSYILIRAFALDVPFNAAIIVFIFIGFGQALPNPPGSIGIIQYACVLALGLFGVDQATAVAYGLTLNAIQLLTLIVQGLIALPIAGVSVGDMVRAVHEHDHHKTH